MILAELFLLVVGAAAFAAWIDPSPSRFDHAARDPVARWVLLR